MSTNRDDPCHQCNLQTAKYTCPKCLRRTCSLECCDLHKKSFSCNGQIDCTEYKPISKYDNIDFIRDFRYLEETQRLLDSIRRDKQHKMQVQNRHRKQLKQECRKLNITLLLMPIRSSRQSINRTWLDYRNKRIEWTVEFYLPNSKKLYAHRIKHDETIANALMKLELSKSPENYVVLYRTIYSSQQNTLEPCSVDDKLGDVLKGKTIVEIPSFQIYLKNE